MHEWSLCVYIPKGGLHYAFYTNGRSFDHECNQPDSKIFASYSKAEAPEQLGEFAIDLLRKTDADIVPGE